MKENRITKEIINVDETRKVLPESKVILPEKTLRLIEKLNEIEKRRKNLSDKETKELKKYFEDIRKEYLKK